MTDHLTDSDREALRLAQELRDEMSRALSRQGHADAPAVSPFVDAGGRPSVLVRLDAGSVHALSQILGEFAARTGGRPIEVQPGPAAQFPAQPHAAPAPYPMPGRARTGPQQQPSVPAQPHMPAQHMPGQYAQQHRTPVTRLGY